MKIPSTDISFIKDAFTAASRELADAYDEVATASRKRSEETPEMLLDAMDRLLDTWHCFENDRENPEMDGASTNRAFVAQLDQPAGL